MVFSMIVGTIAIPSLLRSRQAANESTTIANLRTIVTAEAVYSSTARGNYGSLDDLMKQGLLDSRFSSAVQGHHYAISVLGRSYIATALPVSPNDGRYGYLVAADGVVRYSTAPNLAPPTLAGQPVR